MATKLLLLLLSFVPVSISVPSCVVEDPYCELDDPGVNIIQSEYGVESWNECQTLCLSASDEGCASFLWYGPDSAPFSNACFLFGDGDPVCVEEEEREDYFGEEYGGCVYGMPRCKTCGFKMACQAGSDNVISSKSGVSSEVQCQRECLHTPGCNFYTHFAEDSETLPGFCQLFSRCESYLSCTNGQERNKCSSGPKKCRFGEPCWSGEAAFSTSGTANHFGGGYPDPVLLTMGCRANLTVLAMGGGAASGSTGSVRWNGGGGSGYVSLVEGIDIPYSNRLDVNIGRGGQTYEDTSVALNGGPTWVTDEDGRELVRAEGALRPSWNGGDGFSGGGAGGDGEGKGGSDGEGGEDGDVYKGGKGSGVSVEMDLQPAFEGFVLSAGARGYPADEEKGGGGGGIEVEGLDSGYWIGSSYARRAGGFGAGCSNGDGVGGMVLFEVKFEQDGEYDEATTPEATTTEEVGKDEEDEDEEEDGGDDDKSDDSDSNSAMGKVTSLGLLGAIPLALSRIF